MLKNKGPSRSRGFGKVSRKMAEMPVIKISCGSVKGNLHKNKFYCPGIHRECIEYNGSFITPKMFSVMGDKEKLKDWKNAIRINSIQVRKYIESGTLDFYRHDEFCTGRCIARSPVNRGSHTVPDSSGLKVEFVSSINEHTYCHLPDDGEGTSLPLPTVTMSGQPTPVDVKPNIALLQSLLEKPLASVDVLPPDVAAALANQKFAPEEEEIVPCDPEVAEEDRQFWVGIMELGLLEHFFREIKVTLDTVKSDLVTFQVRTKDAVRISSLVRNLGLMKRFKCRLSSFKSDMDQQQAKIDAEMNALKHKVTQYELRKEALKRKSEKFEFLMDMGSEKKAYVIEKNEDNSANEEEEEEEDLEEVDVYLDNEDGDDEVTSDDEVSMEEEEEEEKETVCEKHVSVPTAVSLTPNTGSTFSVSMPTTSTTTSPQSSASTANIQGKSPRTVAKTSRPSVNIASTNEKRAKKSANSSRHIVGISSSGAKSTAARSGSKFVPVPSRDSATFPGSANFSVAAIRPPSPFKITTLPADSSSNYIIKNSSLATISHLPPVLCPVNQSKKGTLIRQVLMDTTSDGDAMERVKEAAVNNLKGMSSQTAKFNSSSETAISVSKPKSDAVTSKGKIRIIARCKPKVNAASSVVVPTTSSPHATLPSTSSSSSSSTHKAVTSALCTTAASAAQTSPVIKSSNSNKIPMVDAVPKVILQDFNRKKFNPTKFAPKSKTTFSVDMSHSVGAGMSGEANKVTFESGCQTPIDGVRENPPTLGEKNRDTAAGNTSVKHALHARRSSRKTMHLFSWGMKERGGPQNASSDQDLKTEMTQEELLNYSYEVTSP